MIFICEGCSWHHYFLNNIPERIDGRETTGIYNFGSGVTSTWIDLVKPIFEILNRLYHIEFIMMPNFCVKNTNITLVTIFKNCVRSAMNDDWRRCGRRLRIMLKIMLYRESVSVSSIREWNMAVWAPGEKRKFGKKLQLEWRDKGFITGKT
jgi:hypothetical protein